MSPNAFELPSVGTKAKSLVTITRSTRVRGSRSRRRIVWVPAVKVKVRGLIVSGTPAAPRPLTRVHCQLGPHVPWATS